MRKILPYCHHSFSLENVKGSSNYEIIKSGRSLDLAFQLGAMTRRDCHVASLLTMTMIGLFSFNAQATCTPTPDCASIGYSETSCEGDSLKCPFDITKMMCMPCDSSFRYDCSGDNIVGGTGSACAGKYVSCTCSSTDYIFYNGSCICDTSCKVGAIYYSDKTCSACVDSNKTVIGIVVKDNELVMSNTNEGIQWGGYAIDIPSITNYSSNADAKTDFNGKDNTAKIVAHLGEDVDTTLYAGVFCYKYSTKGTNAGDWYLPAAGELYSYVFSNYSSKLSSTATKLDWDIAKSFLSSSEKSNNHVWLSSSNRGNVGYGRKDGSDSVTCFLAIN